MVATIELARDENENPRPPDWLEEEYFEAIQQLAGKGIAQLPAVKDQEEFRAILSILAISKGFRTYARLILNYSEGEPLEFESSFGL